jgi:6-phosphogluconolactonase/glucosamine-6-phosphate isomerase/deaminase
MAVFGGAKRQALRAVLSGEAPDLPASRVVAAAARIVVLADEDAWARADGGR